MRIPRVAIFCFVIGSGSGAFVGCGGSNAPKAQSTTGNASSDDPPDATCDSGDDCASGGHEGDETDMGDDTGEGGDKGKDMGKHNADAGHHHSDGGDDGDDGNN